MKIGLILSIALLLLLLFQDSRAMDTIVVDNLAEWRSPILHVGDSLVFEHEHFQNLYLFRNRRAFDLCNFDYAILVYDGKTSHFTWRPSRPGYYYLATGDNSRRCCQNGEKVPVRVITPDPSSGLPTFPAPAPTSGADISSSPSYTRSFISPSSGPASAPVDVGPLQPREKSTTPAAAPQTPGSVPFISSSPAVPLPVGETDSATILPFPTPGSSESQVVGMASSCVAVRMSLLMALAMLIVFG